ncbi:hypothetical protein A1sIIB76_00185 [Candidatus Planktophila versatilis]|uniref:Uncharacterized protein n=1 Tax=Candidatus Planktophila versatilis TaxID=1884905 RepID=A0AAD0E683_9ACTN|nr:hypothetical protein A1sIIB76_00185 [Candidatus Planktophila versatilis]
MLQNLYQHNYLKHDAFRFTEPALTLNPILLDKFNSTLGSSREKITSARFRESKNLLKEIVHELSSQCPEDEFLALFLFELFDQVETYLDDEFSFRARVVGSQFSDELGAALGSEAYYYGRLDERTLSQLSNLILHDVEIFRNRAAAGQMKRSDLSVNDGETVSKISSILNSEFKKNGTFHRISNYVGIRYSYVGVSLELSVSGSTWWKNAIEGVATPKTMYAHLDESIFAPKAIVYLSDVTEGNGPTCSYPHIYDQLENNTLQDIIGRVIGSVGNNPTSKLHDYYSKSYHQSMSSRNFRKHFMKLPETLRFNSHFGWDILAGSEFESQIAEREEVLLGPAGTFVVFDGSRLLHRGGLIEAGERIVLQVVFWPKPTFIEKIERILKRVNRLVQRSTN